MNKTELAEQIQDIVMKAKISDMPTIEIMSVLEAQKLNLYLAQVLTDEDVINTMLQGR